MSSVSGKEPKIIDFQLVFGALAPLLQLKALG